MDNPLERRSIAWRNQSSGILQFQLPTGKILCFACYLSEQYTSLLNKNIVIQPGDRLNTHCMYRRQSHDVPFALGSSEEMCNEIIFYWPKLPGSLWRCGYDFVNGNNYTACGDVLMTKSGQPLVLEDHGKL